MQVLKRFDLINQGLPVHFQHFNWAKEITKNDQQNTRFGRWFQSQGYMLTDQRPDFNVCKRLEPGTGKVVFVQKSAQPNQTLTELSGNVFCTLLFETLGKISLFVPQREQTEGSYSEKDILLYLHVSDRLVSHDEPIEVDLIEEVIRKNREDPTYARFLRQVAPPQLRTPSFSQNVWADIWIKPENLYFKPEFFRKIAYMKLADVELPVSQIFHSRSFPKFDRARPYIRKITCLNPSLPGKKAQKLTKFKRLRARPYFGTRFQAFRKALGITGKDLLWTPYKILRTTLSLKNICFAKIAESCYDKWLSTPIVERTKRIKPARWHFTLFAGQVHREFIKQGLLPAPLARQLTDLYEEVIPWFEKWTAERRLELIEAGHPFLPPMVTWPGQYSHFWWMGFVSALVDVNNKNTLEQMLKADSWTRRIPFTLSQVKYF